MHFGFVNKCSKSLSAYQSGFAKWFYYFGTSNRYISCIPQIELQNVLFVPTFGYNLFSVSKWLSDSQGRVVFLPDSCEFYGYQSTTSLITGKLFDGLYHLDSSEISVVVQLIFNKFIM